LRLAATLNFDYLIRMAAIQEDKKGYSAELRRIAEVLDAGDLHLAEKVAEAAIERFPKVIRIRDSLTAILDARGNAGMALSICAETARIQVKRLEKVRQKAGKPPRSLQKENRVFICGYFYSGSGAVYDYLKDFPGLVGWTPAGEMRLIKFPGGMWDLVSRCKSEGGLDAQSLLDFYLHIKGKKIVDHAPDVYSGWGKVNKHSRALWQKEGGRYYLEACLRCFLELHRRWRGEKIKLKDLKKVLKDYLRQAFDAAATECQAGYLLIDQAINAFRLELAELVPPSKFIVVHRDPRDQYVDASVALSQPGRKLPSAEEFSESYRSRRNKGVKYTRIIERKFGHEVLTLSFEDFVLNFDQSHRLVDKFLGLDHCGRRGRFSAEKSKVNIGKYRGVLKESEVESFCVNNREYLSEYVTHLAGEL